MKSTQALAGAWLMWWAESFVRSGRRFKYSASRTCRRLRRAPIRISRSKSAWSTAVRARRSRASMWTGVSRNWAGCSGARRSPTGCGPRHVRCWGVVSRPPRLARPGRRKANQRRKAKAKERKRRVGVARKYLIETFGCQMNFHDSERMAGLLEQAGFEATAEAADAD